MVSEYLDKMYMFFVDASDFYGSEYDIVWIWSSYSRQKYGANVDFIL